MRLLPELTSVDSAGRSGGLGAFGLEGELGGLAAGEPLAWVDKVRQPTVRLRDEPGLARGGCSGKLSRNLYPLPT